MTDPKKRTAKPKAKTPERPANLPHGRWLGDLEPLSDAERELVRCCGRGEGWAPEGCDPENPVRPAKPTPENAIRGQVIRFLALGGDAEHPMHENGLMLAGTWISGQLNLGRCTTAVRLSIMHSHFETFPVFKDASVPELEFAGSFSPGIFADGVQVKGSLLLRDGFQSNGGVRLIGATIGGTLECQNSQFVGINTPAINADSMQVGGSIFFRDGFAALGEVRLPCAIIGGVCEFQGAYFKNQDGVALNAQGVKVAGYVLLNGSKSEGTIDLTTASVATLADGDATIWEQGKHFLDGFQYGQIAGTVNSSTRIDWLKRQVEGHLELDFRPQPWEQLIRVLREMGHPHEASAVAIAKQKAMRDPKTGKFKPWSVRRGLHWLYGFLAGYGYRPLRTVGAMAAVWFLFSFIYWAGADYYAAFGPANPVITSEQLYPDAEKLCGHGNEPGKQRWTECAGVPDEYTTFQPFLYSLDLILPLVDLQQERDWAPIAAGPTGTDLFPGVVMRWLMWFEILFGWAASLILVAVLGRLVEKD